MFIPYEAHLLVSLYFFCVLWVSFFGLVMPKPLVNTQTSLLKSWNLIKCLFVVLLYGSLKSHIFHVSSIEKKGTIIGFIALFLAFSLFPPSN